MDPTPAQAAEGALIIDVLAAVLDRLVESNMAQAMTDPGQITKFHALNVPGICIRDYLERIYKFASCSNECYVLALIYIDRLIQKSNFLLTELNVHRVLITAILLAAKFFDDAYYNNAYYARIGGVLVSEMNGLEVDFLFRINFSLRVTPELFVQYKDELVPRQPMGFDPQPTIMEEQAEQSYPSPQQNHQPQHQHYSQHQHEQFPMVQDPSINFTDAPASRPQTDFAMVDTDLTTASTLDDTRNTSPSPADDVDQPRMNTITYPNPPSENTSETINPGVIGCSNPSLNPNAINQYNQTLFQAGLARVQMIHRANSLPVPINNNAYTSQTGKCAPQPYSAPMVAMLPINSNPNNEQYLLLANNVMPLQTALVHHHHGIAQLNEEAAFHQRNHPAFGQY